MPTTFHILPIRHHGPGSARSVVRALDRLRPECLLIEGPPDAQEILPLAGEKEMVPPVALLVHAADNPAHALFYPFARFSPEWNAIRWALAHKAEVRFFDLPLHHRLALDRAATTPGSAYSGGEDGSPSGGEQPPAVLTPSPAAQIQARPSVRMDPLGELARAAGFDDGERWWEHIVEHRRRIENDPDADLSLFAAIREAMGALREKDDVVRDDDPLREAYMRRCMRQATAEGFQTVAVVCGAFHAPALIEPENHRKTDDALLKGLPKLKTDATWVPWTHELLTTASGYGAGVRSPGWYDHLFTHDTQVLERWMTQIARLMRDEDIDCSSAHIIEAVRLAESLAAMRARPIADLSDIADSIRSVFCHDSDAPLRLISRKLLIGDTLGEVPESAPQVPLQRDLARLQKSLRLKPEALERRIELDLRTETDLARSQLLHRLILLGVPWGTPEESGRRTKGTFKEVWTLRWEPHFVVQLIQAARYGNTVEGAAAASVVRRLADHIDSLPALADMLDTLILAELPTAQAALLKRIDEVAAVAADVGALMDALPPIVRALRYGTVRNTDTALLTHSVTGILPRITSGIGPAVGNVSDDLAEQFGQRISHCHEAVLLLGADGQMATDWMDMLQHLLRLPNTHGLLQGRAGRLLFDASKLSADAISTAMSIALSPGTLPNHAAAWLQGFLDRSGMILIHDQKLLGVIDQWVGAIPPEAFEAVLPLLRRTFATFEPPERRQIGQQLARGLRVASAPEPSTESGLDESRAARVLPTLKLILKGKP